MNSLVRQILEDRLGGRENDMYGYDMYGRDSARGRGRGRDYGRDDMRYDERERYDGEEYERDGRRGVKGTGRYSRSRRYRRRDRGETLSLDKSDIMRWKHNLQNADGTEGPHFDMKEIMKAAQEDNMKFEDYDEKELCMTANMLYSDYCEVFRKFIPPDRESDFYVELAKAFLEDEDGPEPCEKLALYYYCIADNE